MKKDTVETKENNDFLETVEAIKNEVRDYFSKFNSPEFKEANPELSDRIQILMEAFATYKDGIELETEYVIDGDALFNLKKIVTDLLQSVQKSVDETNNYISMYDIVTSGSDKVVFKQTQLQYVGDMFSKCSFTTIEEAREIKAVQDGLRPVFNELFFNTKKIQMAAQAAQSIEAGWKTEGLPQEDAEIDSEISASGE